MRQLAMRAVDLAALVVERHDLGHLVLEQPVRRAAPEAAVGQLAERTALCPAPGPGLTQLELSTRSPQAPAGVSGLVEEVEQGGLGSRRSGAVRASFSDHAVIPAESQKRARGHDR